MTQLEVEYRLRLHLADSETLDQAEHLAGAWALGEVSVDDIPMSGWSPHAAVHFINNLPIELDEDQLGELDSSFGFSASRNAEISRAWFIQVAKRRYLPAYKAMETHLNRYGRTRLIKPVYVALAKNGEDTELALQLFEAAKSSYHPLTISAIEIGFNKAK